MADTLGNIEIQEIESINVMPMDTPISFGEMSVAAQSLVEKFEEEGLPTGKDANKCIEVSDAENNFDGLSTTPRILRRMHAQQQASILVDLVEESKEIYRFIVLELGQTHKSVIVMKTSLPLLESSLTIGNKLCMPEHVSEVPHLILRDPHISQTKGRKKDAKKCLIIID
ncbi:hypothetical protein JHK82_048296 [Glycine max]|nr:hypothetical protein JHK82_048296 [Glycine max]